MLTISATDPYLPSEHHHHHHGGGGTSTTTRLIIDLIDLNDNTPQFDPSTPARFYVNENTPTNTTIYHITAFDMDKSTANSALVYRIVADSSELFGLDAETGRLFVAAGELDYERLATSPNVSLTIECSDRGETERRRAQLTITIVVMDVNDNAPQFERSNQTIIIKESFPVGQEITRFKVYDRDGTHVNRGPFSFEIVNTPSSIFDVTKNGSLTLTRRPLRNITYHVIGNNYVLLCSYFI